MDRDVYEAEADLAWHKNLLAELESRRVADLARAEKAEAEVERLNSDHDWLRTEVTLLREQLAKTQPWLQRFRNLLSDHVTEAGRYTWCDLCGHGLPHDSYCELIVLTELIDSIPEEAPQ